jgi:hypothetical protein
MVTSFLALFHRYSYILKPISGGSWFSANDSWQLTDTEILKAIACAHPRYFIGARAGRATRYAVLDIDSGSKYHNQKSLGLIRRALSDGGITKSALFRSSYSDGWHLYMFFDEPVSSKDLRNQLVQLLKLKGFVLAKGILEIFPHPGENSDGQGLRLPLQPGFAWLNPTTLEVEYDRAELSPTKALTYFLDDLEHTSHSRHDFHRLKAYVEKLSQTRSASIESAKTMQSGGGVVVPFRRKAEREQSDPDDAAIVASIFGTLPPGINASSWLKGRNYAMAGLGGPSQRADAIFCLSHYLFYGDPEFDRPALGYGYEQQRTWVMEQLLNDKHNGQSKDISEGRQDALAQVTRAANWVPPHKRGQELEPYQSNVPVSWVRNRVNLKLDARKRIEKAVAQFTTNGTAFSLRDLKEASGCSTDTLYKHKDLWAAAQKQLRDRLATDPGEYNAGVGAAPQESQPPAPSNTEICAPGRLAARRIVFEIKARAEREAKAREREMAQKREDSTSQWRQRIIEWLPRDLATCQTKELVTVLVFYRSMLMRSPDEEQQQWLVSRIDTIKGALASRPLEVLTNEAPQDGNQAKFSSGGLGQLS